VEAWPRDAVVDEVALLRRESRSLVQRLRLWTPARYAAGAPPWGTRADLVAHLAQRFADDAARLEGQPLRALPRLDSDLVLADQLAVTCDDLLRAGAGLAREAAAHLLTHRLDLLGDEVPAPLARALGLADVVATGRAVCGPPG